MTLSPTKPSSIITCTFDVLRYLCERARPDEIEQYEAITRRKWDPLLVAMEFYNQGEYRVAVAGKDGLPVAAGGYFMFIDKIWQSWMVGTPEGWESSWFDIHRATRWLTEQLVDSGLAQRLQVSALAKRAAACAWYERLGYTFEGVHRGLGANGEDVAHYGRFIGIVEEVR